jgi:hypothetical protein
MIRLAQRVALLNEGVDADILFVGALRVNRGRGEKHAQSQSCKQLFHGWHHNEAFGILAND